MKAKDPNIVLKPLIAEMLIARMVRDISIKRLRDSFPYLETRRNGRKDSQSLVQITVALSRDIYQQQSRD